MKRNKDNELLVIPGIGKSIAADLQSLGVWEVPDLKDKDPEVLYDQLIHKVGAHVDRCVLYVFREAVYYASHETHDPEKLKWWYWKDKK